MRPSIPIAIAAGVIFGFIAGGGVALWSDGSAGGPVAAEWIVGIVVGVVVALVLGLGLGRASGRDLLGEPKRLAGGLGEESATANPDAS
ncbi:MAG: hypothetical protein Q8K58_13710 [Acidimicrobiales bacterium]|nr:hypothetical protein [Acidimicrobiales bacterium]